MVEKNLWWGYKHVSGTYQAKRYFDALDLTEARMGNLCSLVIDPFEADNRDEALKIVEDKCNQINGAK